MKLIFKICKKFIIIALAVILHAFPGLGADVYVAQTFQGTGIGSSAVNAEPLNLLNWSTLHASDTVHLCGVITNEISFTASGVIVCFEPNAKISRPSGQDMSVAGANNVIDGGPNGIIENTANGTGLAFSNAVTGIDITAAVNVTLRNLHFNNLYIHSSTNDVPKADLTSTSAIRAHGMSGSNYIYNCTFSNVCWCLAGGGGALESISNCTFVNYDHGIVPDATNIIIANCDFGSTVNWDTYNDTYHHDGIHYFTNPSTVSQFLISKCKFHGSWGNNNTAFIFLESAPANVTVVNNLFLASGWLSDGMLYCGGNTNLIYNNSFVGSGTTNSTALNLGSGNFYTYDGGSGDLVMNNLFSGTCVFAVNYSTNHVESFNYNVYGNRAPGGNPPFSLVHPNTQYTFPQWQAVYGDVNSIYTSAIVVNADGTLSANSLAVGAGTNLSNVFITDFTGSARPLTGPWTIGAYQFVLPLPPQNLHVVISGK